MKRLKQLRIEKNLSIPQLGKALGVKSTQVTNYENKAVSLPIANMMRMCEYFNVSMDYMFGHSDESKPFRAFDINIGKRIKELRLDASLGQKQLGEKVGLTMAAINRYENGNREPKIGTIISLCKVFNVSVDYLLGLDEKQ